MEGQEERADQKEEKALTRWRGAPRNFVARPEFAVFRMR